MAAHTPTLQLRSSLMRVLVVHDDPRPVYALAEALRATYVVRNVHGLRELGEQAGLLERLGCIVCVPCRTMRSREVRDEALRMGLPPERIVYVGLDELARLDEVLETVRLVVESSAPRPRLAG